MRLKEIEKRLAELDAIVESATTEEAINAAVEERQKLVEEKAKIEALEQRRAQAKALQNNKVVGVVVEADNDKEKEIRNSKEYIDAYAEYVKTGKADECRALLTTDATSGTIAVPDFVYEIVKTSWDKNDIMRLVKKIEIKGNMKVQFEISGTDAVIHDEGSGAVAEETLTEGIVTMVPKMVKKWISISDEVLSMRGEAFLRYIYDELTQKIVKKMCDELIAKISNLSGSADATHPNVGVVTLAPAMATIASAVAALSDEAANPVVVMNKLTWGTFKGVQYANGYGADPFEGLSVHFNNSLPAYDSANTNDIYMIVGDFGYGALANMPNGDVVDFTFDEYTRKKEDLVEVLGKEYAAVDVIACKAFTQVKKPASL